MMKIHLRQNTARGQWEAAVIFPHDEGKERFYLISSDILVPADVVVRRVQKANPGADVKIVDNEVI